MYFESSHSFDEKEFFFHPGRNLNFPSHLHYSFEFFLVTAGKTKVTINQTEYFLEKGQAVLVFPYQIHSYEVIEETDYFIGIFSPLLVSQFHQLTKTKLPCSNQFSYEKEVPQPTNLFQQKALVYDICGQFHQTATYQNQDKQKSDLLTQLLLYISEHYKSECLLKNATKEIRYDYAYLSKFFKRATGIPFHSYLTRLRIHESCRLLSSTDMSINQIAEKCGFSSLRTFHRDFKHLIGVTPNQYKKTKAYRNDQH